MYKFIRIILLSSLLSVCVSAYADQAAKDKYKEVTGVVMDANSRAGLPSVQISSIDMQKSVITDSTGRFTLKVKSGDAVLSFKADGYYIREVRLFSRDNLKIYLQNEEKTERPDMYLGVTGLEKFSERTGSAESVEIDNLSDAYTSLAEALSGKFTGLKVSSKSGMPGEGAFFNLRGVRTLMGDNNPLIVIDGVPLITDKTSSSIINGYSPDVLDPAILGNIERVSFLKGADALPFGSLGSNGVLMIETQRGKVSRTAVEFKSVEGVAMAVNNIPMLSGLDFSRYMADISGSYFADSESIGKAFPFLSGNMTPAHKSRYGYNTDWQKKIYAPALQTDNMLKVRGGDAVVQYLVTAGYQTSDGVINGTGRTKLYTGGNTNINFSDKLRAFASVSFDFIEADLQEQGMTPETNPILAAYSHSPITGMYEVDKDGGVLKKYAAIDPLMKVSNPSSILDNVIAKNKIYDFVVNLGIEYDFLKNLKGDIKFGIFYKYIKDDIFIGGMDTESIAPLLNGLALNTVRSGASESRDYFGKAGLKYIFERKGHSLNVAGGYQIVYSSWGASSGSGINTTTDMYRTLSNVSSIERRTGGYAEVLNWMNGYLKADYDFRNQYYLTAAVELDKSSSYGYYSRGCYVFPAVKAGWKISNMPLIRDSESISNLMLRAEYSVNPNSRFSNALSSYYYNLRLLRDVSGLVRAGIPNEKLGPEKVATVNVGLDFALFGDKFSMSADLYQEDVNDMIVASGASSVYGYSSICRNEGHMRTRGVELNLSGTVIDRGFYWRLGGTFSLYDTRVMSLGRDRRQFIDFGDGVMLVNEVGSAPYSFYGFKAAGVYATSAEAEKDGLKTTGSYRFTGGDMKFVSLNGDKLINDRDKTIIGNPAPLFYGGIYSKMTWRGFTLYADFAYSYGNSIYNAVRRYNESGSSFRNQAASMGRRWVTEGQQTDIPRVEYNDPAGNSRFSSRWIEDGSYLKLKELTLSWETKDRVLFLTGLKVFATAENLFCLTRYKGADPEFAYSYDIAMAGMDVAKIPVPKFFKLGVVLNL